jgi:hypothetical protein
MKSSSFLIFAAWGLSAWPPISFAKEHKIGREQLPAAVAATVDRETQGASIKGYGSEKENGKLSYEVETMINGHRRDLAIAPDGSLEEIEEEVPMSSLDPSVQGALAKKAKDKDIIKVESLTKHGKLVAYEAATDKNGHKGEIQVGPSGEMLTHEE